MIKKDESFTEEIPDGAEINIIEDRDIPNIYYYESIMKKYGNSDIRNIIIEFPNQAKNKIILYFPGNATISELVKTINYKFDDDYNKSKILLMGRH